MYVDGLVEYFELFVIILLLNLVIGYSPSHSTWWEDPINFTMSSEPGELTLEMPDWLGRCMMDIHKSG